MEKVINAPTIASLAILFLPFGCSKEPPHLSNAKQFEKMLPDATATEELVKLGKIGLVVFTQRLDSDDPEARDHAATTLVRFGKPGVSVLSKRITDDPKSTASMSSKRALVKSFEKTVPTLFKSLLVGDAARLKLSNSHSTVFSEIISSASQHLGRKNVANLILTELRRLAPAQRLQIEVLLLRSCTELRHEILREAAESSGPDYQNLRFLLSRSSPKLDELEMLYDIFLTAIEKSHPEFDESMLQNPQVLQQCREGIMISFLDHMYADAYVKKMKNLVPRIKSMTKSISKSNQEEARAKASAIYRRWHAANNSAKTDAQRQALQLKRKQETDALEKSYSLTQSMSSKKLIPLYNDELSSSHVLMFPRELLAKSIEEVGTVILIESSQFRSGAYSTIGTDQPSREIPIFVERVHVQIFDLERQSKLFDKVYTGRAVEQFIRRSSYMTEYFAEANDKYEFVEDIIQARSRDEKK